MDLLSRETGTPTPVYSDPIISAESVKWAARRFILVYGEAAPDMAERHVNQLDARGSIRTAEMFSRVRMECARLLKKTEHFRLHPVN
ncbi:MAG: hypothetical protein EP348_04715 [Alphaproteobacteria bacterium]|nr:MAG: hypothetical protein EP348_04715 [Alphaproteobacteria bacterium]